MTSTEQPLLDVTGVMAKISELIESQERYADVLEKIRAAEQKVLLLVDPEGETTETTLDFTCTKETLDKLLAEMSSNHNEDVIGYNNFMYWLFDNFINTEVGSASALVHLNAIIKGLDRICKTKDKKLQNSIHKVSKDLLAVWGDGVAMCKLERFGQDWSLGTPFEEILKDMGLDGDTTKARRETLRGALAHAKAAICAVEELDPIFRELRKIDETGA